MKTLISGIIGAVAAAVAWMALEHQLQANWPYMALAVGLVTGIAVRAGAEAGSGESFGRGALAAILALAACVGGRFGYVEYMKNVNEDADKPRAGHGVVAQVDDADDADAETDDADTGDTDAGDTDTDDADADDADADATADAADADAEDSDADAEEDDADDADAGTDDQDSKVDSRVVDNQEIKSVEPGFKMEKPSLEATKSPLDILWLGGAGLLAYIVGKSGGSGPTPVTEGQTESAGDGESA